MKSLQLLLLALIAMPNMAADDLASSLLQSSQLSAPVDWFLLLTALSFIPIVLVSVTTFTRNIVVLSLLRQALGLQQTPPNIVLLALSFFLTAFTMSATFNRSYEQGIAPYLDKKISFNEAAEQAWVPLRDFMVHQTRESDLALVHELAKAPLPDNVEQLKPVFLIPAFMLGELKVAFQIGFIIFLPFLLIDLVVASILMSLGMIMVPPVTIALPLKILLFLIVDGWALVAQTLVKSATG